MRDGERFVDEGADFRNYTYAKYGRVILMQPGQFAWQVFDKKIIPMLRDEYRIKRVTKVRADTLEELAQKARRRRRRSAPARRSRPTTRRCSTDVPFNPNVKDGRSTEGLAINKSNWANTDRRAAVRGLCGDLRRHLHVRRREDRHRGPR